MIPKNQPGHPIVHQFAPATAFPLANAWCATSIRAPTCINSYVGYMWWDEETDGQLHVSAPQQASHRRRIPSQSQMSNPDEAAGQGLWSDPEFLANLTDLNTQTQHTQFADFHSHGWVFRAVFKKDRAGPSARSRGEKVEPNTNEKLRAPSPHPPG